MLYKQIIFSLGFVCISISLGSAQTFTRIDTGAIATDGGDSQGSSWGDFDNDGDVDLFVTNGFGEDNFLYRNDGSGNFVKITSGPVVSDGGDSFGSSWGDFNNDGNLDLFVANYDEDNFLYRNDGSSNFVKITSGPVVNGGGDSQGSSWGDFDNDGNLDLFVANYDEDNFLYRNDGSGNFVKITSGPMVNGGGDSQGSSWGDFDNDGNLDLFVANGFGEDNFLYRNDGSGNFVKITSGPVVSDGGESYGSSWGDFDNDGNLDLFVVNGFGEDNFLYRNDGSGNFVKVTSGPMVNGGGDSQGSSWGDFDNDGNLDLFVANYDEDNFLYRNDGSGNFVKITSGPVVSDGGKSYGSNWGDFDNDGNLDLFVTNSDEDNFLYRNDGSGNFAKITSGLVVSDGGESYGSSWGDFDNDGNLDLFVANGFGEDNFLYRNDGSGNFVKITSGPVANDGGSSFGSSWGDFDNDGNLDLFVANYDEDNFLYRNDGSGNFAKITSGLVVSDGGESYGSSWGDFDNDGNLDLFVANGFEEDNFLYRNDGSGNFVKITSGPVANDGGSSFGSSWCDFDNDGDLDLFVTNSGENNLLYQNNGNSNTWVNIKLIGMLSNTSAIGVKVKVKAMINGQPIWQIRELSGQTGYLSQNSLNAEFGLNDAAVIDSIRIEWPSGIVQDTTEVAINQHLTITEKVPSDFIQVNFTANTTVGVPPLTVRFTDQSIANPPIDSWMWDFDNDGTFDSQQQHPVHQYTAANVYSVKLIVSNSSQTNTLIRTDYIIVPQFSRITSGPVGNDGGLSFGSSWGDFDNVSPR